MISRAFDPIRQVVNENYATCLIALFGIVSFSVLVEQPYMPIMAKIFVPWLVLIAVFNPTRGLRAAMILIATLLLAWNVFGDWYRVANHSFMITFIGAALFLMIAAEEQGEDAMRFMARYILCALMALALVQKLISPYYMSGNLMADYILTIPDFFSNLISIVSIEHLDTIREVERSEFKLRNAPPSELSNVAISVPPVIATIAFALTYSSIFWQAVLEGVLIFKARLGLWTHGTVILFVLIIYATVDENEFLSMNCLLGYAMTDESTKRARFWYVLLIFFLLTFKLMGIRPNLVS